MSTEKISAAVKTCLDHPVNGFGDYARQDRHTVPEGVRVFLIVCGDAPDVWERMERFIQKLRTDSRWTNDAVADVGSLIVERLTA